MKQILIKKGRAVVSEAPAPMAQPGNVLVRVAHSCISLGTELAGVKQSGEPLWKRALKHPDEVARVLAMVARDGVRRTSSLIKGVLESGSATGYSTAGVVVEVGEGVGDIQTGDIVACAGAQCAHHAEVIMVPRNLCTPVPSGVSTEQASTVALGAIAMQGVRRAAPTLGETMVVMGLGLLGGLTVQMLKASGCKVIGVDPVAQRVEVARNLGMDWAIDSDGPEAARQVLQFTDGIGADGVIITASGSSSEIASQAFNYCRKKGRVVLVGDVGLELKRADFYAKEIDFLISCSYGPGRYDHRYEHEGVDYPISHVRWTENRNMSQYLEMLAAKTLTLEEMNPLVFSVEEAGVAFTAAQKESPPPLVVLLSYPQTEPAALPVRRVENRAARPAKAGRIKLAVVGAGQFSRGMHLPNLSRLDKAFHLSAVVSRTGHNAASAATQFQADYSTTDYQQVLDDQGIEAVLLCTRHDLHCRQALLALEAGKHVLLEKPLALDREQLQALDEFMASRDEDNPSPLLLTGFNRRFAPMIQRIKEFTGQSENPLVIRYLMNAGRLPKDHWVFSDEGGGRNLGEACHIYDLFTYLTGSRAINVQSRAVCSVKGYYGFSDNFSAVISFDDGSVAELTYTAMGSSQYPKERMEVFCQDSVFEMIDYKQLNVFGRKSGGSTSRLPDKGHMEELKAFARSIQDGGGWPIAWWEQMQATEIAIEVEEQLSRD